MAALLDVVREWQQELRNGIAWVAFWKEGPSWDAHYVYLDENDLLFWEDETALEEIIETDPHAVVLNSYYCGQLAEDMNVNELATGVRHHYDQGTNSVAGFLFKHKNLMSDLYDKVIKEQEQYESWLLNQKPSAILEAEQGRDAQYRVIKEREKLAADGRGYDIPPEADSFSIYQMKQGPDTLMQLVRG